MRRQFIKISYFLCLAVLLPLYTGTAQDTGRVFHNISRTVVIKNIPFNLKLQAFTNGALDTSYSGVVDVSGLLQKRDGDPDTLTEIGPFARGELEVENIVFNQSGAQVFMLTETEQVQSIPVRVLPGLLSLLPPLVAILLAIIFRQVLVSLFAGIWLGATFIWDYNPFHGLLHALDHYLVNALADPDHVAIVMFSMMLGGMVGILSKSGGTQGIVARLSKFAGTSTGGQIMTWAMGVFIFFDDYANTLLVGNTMRSFTDRLRISREKLSYIVDSTAAPVASIAIFSTWVGFEMGLLYTAFKYLGVEQNIYILFVKTIPYRFYGIFTIIFVFLVALTGRDFGPMFRAEQRARRSGKVLGKNAVPLSDHTFDKIRPSENTPLRWYNAVIPVLVVIAVIIWGLFYDGRQALYAQGNSNPSLYQIVGAANPFPVLMWASFAGSIVAALLAMGQRILSLRETIEAWLAGIKSMLIAMIILLLAWSIGQICMDLHTADYVIYITRGLFSPILLPALTFIVAAFISFATGTSWGTMSILIPIIVPMAYTFSKDPSLSEGSGQAILIGSIASVLSGAVFGDHCSPISDTTIMSSMSSGADHVDHVRTQIPYAVVVALVSIFIGYFPVGLGMPLILSIPLGVFLVSGLLLILGKKTDHL